MATVTVSVTAMLVTTMLVTVTSPVTPAAPA